MTPRLLQRRAMKGLLPEVVLTSYAEILVLRGHDGAPITTLAAPGAVDKPFSQAYALPAELDGTPGKELVLVQPHGQVSAKVGPPGITAFDVDVGAKTGVLLYRRQTAG